MLLRILLQLIIGSHYFVLALLLSVLTFFVNSKLARHMSTEHVILFVPGIYILSGLRTYRTRVWMVYSARGPFCEPLRRVRTKIATFLGFLRVRSATLPCELCPQIPFVSRVRELCLRACHVVLLWFTLHSIFRWGLSGSWVENPDLF